MQYPTSHINFLSHKKIQVWYVTRVEYTTAFMFSTRLISMEWCQVFLPHFTLLAFLKFPVLT